MRVNFVHQPHPRIAARTRVGPPTTVAEHVGVNGRIALALTAAVGTMWCAYAFAILALVVLPQAINGGLLPLVQWVSQTFIQLVMLSVIMVGQNILARAADKRSLMTYQDAGATFHEAEQIQAHLAAQDTAINALLDKVEKLEAAVRR
jgi:uncharacterized membrane protein